MHAATPDSQLSPPPTGRNGRALNSKLFFHELLYQRIFELAVPFLQTRDNEIHTKVSYAFAERLVSVEGGDRNIVVPAILLHDVGWIRGSGAPAVPRVWDPHEPA